ncbi:MAG TPA: hypothetical protein VJN65_02440 [Bacteroidota bacterium]|nr:hypothetical protein [Bacteroidota bacterium]
MRLSTSTSTLVFLLLFPLITLGQPKIFSDEGTIQSVLFLAGDLVDIQCDSVFVLNKLTFRRYDSAYRDLRKKGTSISGLMSAYDEIITLQENRLREQTRNYEELRTQFSALTSETRERISDSSARLGSAVTSMENLNRDLIETKKLLGEAKAIIEAEQRGLNLEKLLWGFGGVAVGIVVGVVISN